MIVRDKEPDQSDAKPTRCGFVAVIGAPNAGKSTLVNMLVGAKIAIVTPKVQTTRTRLLGIALHGPAQIVLVDTPGIFKPKRRLERAMVKAAWKGAADADEIVLIADANANPPEAETLDIIAGLKQAERTAILALNKSDQAPRQNLLELAKSLGEEGIFTDTFMISALTGDGVADLKEALARRLPESPWLYPEDQISDAPMRVLAAEVTREKLFLQLHQEVPYAITVETESWDEFQDGSLKVSQVIYVQREGQKAIVLGKGGTRIRSVRFAAQSELEAMLGRKVHLFLFVKLREHWTDDPSLYREMGLDFEA
ncbi:MAG TPA: GTPase Era [Alphaproteobacteria bacterium]|nr:GTPase Era [Alphaproteobacteria bacterium]